MNQRKIIRRRIIRRPIQDGFCDPVATAKLADRFAIANTEPLESTEPEDQMA